MHSEGHPAPARLLVVEATVGVVDGDVFAVAAVHVLREIFSLTYLEDPDRFDAMTPVGHHPDEDL
ncbi:hypothetical protein G9E11_15475 [Arthrobacter sp. IA7]|uniref:hypothetical protein n=1 Tax=Arthrobacter ipis TaxID=2716202 RepID=UPI0016832AA8|nr:hypothetical protein [Arthrobacter ipis]MBD1543606.1 hypothetical protein [Arthrobacter ipis]